MSPSVLYFGTQRASPDTMSNWPPVCLIFRYASALSENSVGRPWSPVAFATADSWSFA